MAIQVNGRDKNEETMEICGSRHYDVCDDHSRFDHFFSGDENDQFRDNPCGNGCGSGRYTG